MLKKLLFITLFLILITSINNSVVLAQKTTEDPLIIVCLAADKINANFDHALRLHSKGGFFIGEPVEIWRTINGTLQCAVDKNGEPLCSDPKAVTVGKEFKVYSNARETKNGKVGIISSDGGITISEVRSWTAEEMAHVFYGVQRIDTTPISAESLAQKLAQAQIRGGSETNCVTINWDPYGIVFDAISYEPIPAVNVELLDSQHKKVPVNPGVKANPFLTSLDGKFNFLVPDGIYYLLPSKQNYFFPLNSTQIAALSGQTVYTDLYVGDPIVQKGKIEHRDIPMNPADVNKPTDNPPQIMSINITSFTQGGTFYQLVYGLTTHPQTIIKAYSDERALGQTSADRTGKFELAINSSLIGPEKPIRLIPEKGSFYALAKNRVGPEVRIDPLPSFLEGYAYDKSLKAVADANVHIVLTGMDNKIAASVKADENGFVRISNLLIPPLPFKIVITDNQGNLINQMTPRNFISLNKKYLDSNQVDLFSDLSYNNTTASYSAVVANPNSIVFAENRVGGLPDSKTDKTASEQTSEKENQGNSLALVFITLIILLMLSGLGMYLFRLRSQHINSPQSIDSNLH